MDSPTLSASHAIDLGTARAMHGAGHDGKIYHLRGWVDGWAVLRVWRERSEFWRYVVVSPYVFHVGSYWWEMLPAEFPEGWDGESRRTETWSPAGSPVPPP